MQFATCVICKNYAMECPLRKGRTLNESSWHFQVKQKILFLGVLEYNKDEKLCILCHMLMYFVASQLFCA